MMSKYEAMVIARKTYSEEIKVFNATVREAINEAINEGRSNIIVDLNIPYYLAEEEMAGSGFIFFANTNNTIYVSWK